MVQAFAGYGFVKRHAAAFAYLAYVSCWLKVCHPAAFYAALLTMQPMGFYPPEGGALLFLGLSDETGLLNVVVPPPVYQRDRAVARGEALLWVTGVLERRGGGPTVRPLAAILT